MHWSSQTLSSNKTREDSTHGHHQIVNTEIRLIIFFVAKDGESESHSIMSDSLQPYGLYSLWNSPYQNTGVGSLSLFQGFFPTQGSTQVSHIAGWLYQQSHKRSPRILEWVVYPFSRESSHPRNWTRVSCIAGGFFTNWEIREALKMEKLYTISKNKMESWLWLRSWNSFCQIQT